VLGPVLHFALKVEPCGVELLAREVQAGEELGIDEVGVQFCEGGIHVLVYIFLAGGAIALLRLGL
jgi:hypothetical protein